MNFLWQTRLIRVTHPKFVWFLHLLIGGSAFSQTMPALVRGPYLQKATPTSITIRWRTEPASVGVVRFGTAANQLTQSVGESSPTVDHEVTLTGLTPATQYFYAIETPDNRLQGDTSNYFHTFPTEGTAKKTRIWSLGDFGNGSKRQVAVRDAFDAFVRKQGDPYIDLWLWLGDNAYSRGLDTEFQQFVFSKDVGYAAGRYMKQTPIFATPGNHDYAGDNTLRLSLNIPYFQIVSNPAQGEAGGLPSGTESYYSFNYGNIHFISLDSDRYEDSDDQTARTRFVPSKTQVAWMKRDLDAAQKNPAITWIIAFWHHPPYTKGTHDSDTEKQLIDVRTNLLPVLEQYDVDLVMCGHSHVYERTDLIRGHYGNALSFDAKTQVVAAGSASVAEYAKPLKRTGHHGTMYIVNGDGGAGGTPVNTGDAPWPHKAMRSWYDGAGGSLYLEIDGNTLTGRRITGDGSVQDSFTIRKQ
ncbi:purple acid phosphatase family protein [Spirosoma montaniterrae]|uniref:Metallophosphoesterase n=1 Tax=Spirosoma montaniterrae TaxID=1178516 RepID=A0A1P9WWX7_9BACT|nr:metallophosphoesterase family protein [Spirosoma montaniterrae]AQG79886.1 hypothetical protein AWR27_11455 [Spirosoma montaniterrae]